MNLDSLINQLHEEKMDKHTTISEIKEVVKHFCEERDWDQFHNAKDLAIGISTEATNYYKYSVLSLLKKLSRLCNLVEELKLKRKLLIFFIL